MRISEISVYLPSLTLGPEFNKRIRGKRRIVGYDEDTVTMGIESASYIEGLHKKDLSKLTFVSSHRPFTERSCASIIATVFDVEDGVKCLDVLADEAGAIDIFSEGKSKEVIIFSEAERYEVNSPEFYDTGHAAVAVFLDEAGFIEIAGYSSRRTDSLVKWRGDGDIRSHTAEFKAVFSLIEGRVRETINEVLSSASVTKDRVWKVYMAMRDQGMAYSLLKSIGFKEEQIWKSAIYREIGYTGHPHALLELVDMIEKENPEDVYILIVGVGSGASAILLRTFKNPSRVIKRGVAENLKHSLSLDSESIYKILGYLPYESVKPFSPHTLYQRDIEQFLKLKAQRCRNCGTVNYPWRFICYKCKSPESFELVPLARTGRIYTYTLDYLNPGPIQPLIMGVADLHDGSRFYGQMTDVKPDEVRVGMEVVLVLRRLHEGGDFVNYFWKLKPRR